MLILWSEVLSYHMRKDNVIPMIAYTNNFFMDCRPKCKKQTDKDLVLV